MLDETTRYVKVASHEAHKGTFDTCLLLYSGGLDTSVMLTWIQEKYKCDIITLTVDIGQEVDDLAAIEAKAKKLGAKATIVVDAKERFANEIITMAIKANSDYQGGYALCTPLGRVVISELAVEYAKKYNCQVVAHGATGKGNDQVRFESYITTLDPSLKIIAPVREWNMGRDEEIAYAQAHDIPVQQTKKLSYSTDENMWGITSEGGEIEHPGEIPNYDAILNWCTPVSKTQEESEDITITFSKGVPVALNNKNLELGAIIKQCNILGGKHGVGVVTLIEDRLVGLKVRGVYENPAATILINAHKKLEQLVSTRIENEFKEEMDKKWAYMVYAAQWYEPTLSHINAYIQHQNKKVSGSVTVRLHKGNVTIVALDSPHSLFNLNLATFDSASTFNQNSSAGFIEIYSLSQRTAQEAYNYEQ